MILLIGCQVLMDSFIKTMVFLLFTGNVLSSLFVFAAYVMVQVATVPWDLIAALSEKRRPGRLMRVRLLGNIIFFVLFPLFAWCIKFYYPVLDFSQAITIVVSIDLILLVAWLIQAKYLDRDRYLRIYCMGLMCLSEDNAND